MDRWEEAKCETRDAVLQGLDASKRVDFSHARMHMPLPNCWVSNALTDTHPSSITDPMAAHDLASPRQLLCDDVRVDEQ